MSKIWIKAGAAVIVLLLAANVAITAAAVLRLGEVERAVYNAAREAPCGTRGTPCHVVVRDAPAPSGGMIDFWYPDDSADDPADDPAYRATREAMERQAREARERLDGSGFGRAPD